MSLKSTEELLNSVVLLEDAVEALDLEITKLVEKAYITALTEHAGMSETNAYCKWLVYNASEDNLKV